MGANIAEVINLFLLSVKKISMGLLAPSLWLGGLPIE